MARIAQLSQEELLLLLGLLRLPMPIALGEDPLGEYGDQTLGPVFSAALHGLFARGYLEQAESSTDEPRVVGEVEFLLRTSALAQGTLMISSRRGASRQAVHYSFRDSEVVFHSTPYEGVHYLEALEGDNRVSDHLLGELGIRSCPAASCDFIVSAQTFTKAIDAALDGQDDGQIRDILVAAGVPVEAAKSFAQDLVPGSDIGSSALIALDGLRSTARMLEGAVVLQGHEAIWYAGRSSVRPQDFAVRSVDSGELGNLLNLLGKRSVTGAAPVLS